ncbi:MAG: ThuA domain-containing protein [Bacteroidia bacterium]
MKYLPSGKVIRLIFLILFSTSLFTCSSPPEEIRVLVFSKTAGFRHNSIEAGIEAIQKLGTKYNFKVDTTENSARFNEKNLQNYLAVVFLNTTQDVLNQAQQNDFERFIQAGGGYVGVHAATDTEYDWPWYNKLAGAWFASHPSNPNVRKGTFRVLDHNHISTDTLPEKWEREDEFYNFRDINPDIHVLIDIDETSYEGGTNGDNHPMAWYHEYDGGRAFYTAMGHTPETFSEPLFLKHLAGGIMYAIGGKEPKRLDYSKAKTIRVPEENRFSKNVLAEGLDEPMQLAVLPDERVLFIERLGKVRLYDPKTLLITDINTIPISHLYNNQDGSQPEAEDGLLGLALDPNFETNSWVYLYYSPEGDKPVNTLTRYEFDGEKLVEESKKVILEVDVQRDYCCHTGGGIAFDGQGNLYLSTGDNTSPRATGYAPLDERPGRSPWDAQKSSGNPNDLRGKIIRIHPEDDGSYTIPEGNLFPEGTENTRPEIYAMGMRNPYRIHVDKKTGYVYWGDVGPDAGTDKEGVGPRGFDEFNQAKKPGFFGWPFFTGNNSAYADYDFAADKAGAMADPAKPMNTSPNNTGIHELPPAQPAMIWYPAAASEEFPQLGTGGRSAMAGPVYHKEDFQGAARPFPDYYDGKWLIFEWMRGWIMAVTFDENGDYERMERFMPSYTFSNPVHLQFGPNGDLYMLEYGTRWFAANDNARLVKIEYNAGNRKPVIAMDADKKKGALPHKVQFSSEGTKDYDYDDLNYNWVIQRSDGSQSKHFLSLIFIHF